MPQPQAEPRPQTGPQPLAIEAHAVCKAFTRGSTTTRVLQSVDLSARRGQCLFLLGPSGSGKTTLMSILGCLLAPDSGRVVLLGRDVTRLGLRQRAELRRRLLGFVFQRFHLIRGLTASENVAVPLRLDGVDPRSAAAKAADLLARVGLSDKACESPHRLSVGQCQRVAIARALAADPQIVLADEPTASLDADAGAQAMRLLRELTVIAGKTLVVVTHDHRILQGLTPTDSIVAMDSGRIVEPAGHPPPVGPAPACTA